MCEGLPVNGRGLGSKARGALVAAAFACALAASSAQAYEPVGSELRISTTETDGVPARDAFEPAIAYNATANEFLVVWSADGLPTDGEFEIFGQRIGPTGAEIGGDFVISETGQTVNDASRGASSPDVTWNGTANEYLVVWEGDDDLVVDNEYEIHGRLVNATGGLIGQDFPLSDQGPPDDDASIWAVEPAVTFNPAQNVYLAVWRGGPASGPGDFEIYGQQLNPNGGAVGADDFAISDAGAIPTGDRQPEDPDVAYGSGPNEYLVTWDGDELTSPGVDNEYEVFGQRLDTTAAEIGADDFRISQGGTDGDPVHNLGDPAVAYGSGPNEYLVTFWGDPFPLDSEHEVLGQRIDATTGAEVGADDFEISTTGAPGTNTRSALDPAVAYSATGNEYVVAWTGEPEPLPVGKFETYAQRLSAAGAEIGTDFRVSTTGGDADGARIAEDPALAFGAGPNAFLSAWDADDLATNDELEIFGRLIGKPASTPVLPNPATPKCKKPKKKKKKRAALSKKKKKKKGCKKKKKKKRK
jgi:hypothetical protein